MAASAVRTFVRFRGCFQVIQALNRNDKTINYSHLHVSWNFQLTSPIFINTQPFRSDSELKALPKPKTVPKPRVTLIGKDGKLSVVLLEDAQKLAKRRDLRLLKVNDIDTKTQRAVYRVVALSESDKSKLKKPVPNTRGEKQVSLSPRISQHDIDSRVKQISKWLQKDLEVKVVINGSAADSSAGELVSQALEKAVTENGGRIVQKRAKDGNIKFNILPPKPTD